MTKIKALQILIYITFGLFILQDILPDAYRGFKDGYSDGNYTATHGNRPRGPLLSTVLNGELLTHNTSGELKIGDRYTLQNITINTEIRLNPGADHTPFLLDALYNVIILTVAVILIIIAVSINMVIVKVAEGTMFDELCIRLIRKTAWLLLLYVILDYASQWLLYYKDSRLVNGPFLKVADTLSVNFQVLLCAVMVFMIAETFKQAARLRQEQELTI